MAAAKAKIAISETSLEFGQRVLQERHPLKYSHADDDWFVLLDVDPKVSGIFFFILVCCFAAFVAPTLLQLDERVTLLDCRVCLQMAAYIHS